MSLSYGTNIDSQFIEKNPFPAFVVNEQKKVLLWNSLSSALFQYTKEEVINIPITDTLFSSLSNQNIDLILNRQYPLQLNQIHLLSKDDQLVSVTLLLTPCRFEHKQAIYITAIPSQDFQTNSSSEQELLDLRTGIEASFMMVTIDNEGFITNCNSHFLKASHWTPKRVLGKTFWKLFPETEDGQKVAQSIWRTLLNGEIWQGEVEKATKNGQTYWVYLTAIPIATGHQTNAHFVLLEKDITNEKTLQLQLEKIAYIDTETGLMNVHWLERVVTEFIEEERHFSFVYLSIDKFYTLKDIQGEDNEQNLIVEFTKRLKMYFQDSTMARINEHEFVIITPLPEWFIQGFLAYLQQHPIYSNNGAVPLSISGGITRYPEDQSSFTHLIKASLATIATVRQAGGDKISSLSKTMQKAINRKSIIEKRLLLALNQKNLKVLYQPIVDTKTGKIVAAEALVRWEDDEIGVVAPDELIPVAEETGLINRIGAFMLEQACMQAVAWKKAGLQLKVSINASVREFRDKNMAKSILNTLAKTNCPTELIQIEITEKFALEAEAETSIIKQMKQLENEGITFVLDDFGTGYASLRYMQLLPIQIVKIDQTFIKSLMKSDKTQRLVDGMVQFGKSMSLQVLAEGVETKEQKQLLTRYGCHFIQGFYVSKPCEPEKIVANYKI